MNENRAQAYLQLINALLTCPNGEEPEILQANSELLDSGFLQACEGRAENLAGEGQETKARFFRNMVNKLGQFLGMNDDEGGDNSEVENPREYLEFIGELLQAENSHSDVVVIYQILGQRQHLLNARFANILQQVAEILIAEHPEAIESILRDIEYLSIHITNFPLGKRVNNIEIAITGYQIVLNNRQLGSEQWAGTQNNLATAYRNRIMGQRAENLEMAIECCTIALQVFTRDTFPQHWAMTQNNLGLAYKERIKGEKNENLEQAIIHHSAALEVYTRDAFPQDWAMVQNNLANAYSNIINAEKAKSLEMAIASYNNALEVFTREAFPQHWAMIQNNLGEAYRKRIEGEKADNLESAIAAYSAALEVRTHDAFPEYWAQTQNNLAIAYFEKIRGEKADNLEKAIGLLTDALSVYTREAFPQNWAMTQNNLANVYTKRIRGEKADNLDLAITSYKNVLEVHTREVFPEDWARTQNNLANVYYYRIGGEKAENLEQTIIYYSAALEVYTRQAFPEDWAITQNNLATAYYYRIRGEKAENLEKAIEFYIPVLEFYTGDAFSQQRAWTQHNLATAYRERIRGEKAENLERAIKFFRAALTVYTRKDFPEDWAMTQNNLAIAYRKRIEEEKDQNIEEAIKCYTAALEVRTRKDFPEDWAQTQNNLGNVYSDRIMGEKDQNIQEAIKCYTAALEVRTRKDFPEDWAQTQNNLGNAYSDRIRGNRAKNIEKAIELYNNALTIRTQEAFPQNYTETMWNLGRLYRSNQQWQLAYNAYAPAIETVELLRGEIHSGDETKQKLAQEWNELYRNMVEVCIELKNYTAAIEYAERSKARNLVELVANRDIKPKGDIPENVLNELSRLRQEISTKQRQLEIEERNRNISRAMMSETGLFEETGFLGNRTHINQLQQKLDELITRDIKPIDPNFSLTQKVEPIPYEEFQSLTGENTAILEWYITEDKFLTFIITPQSPTPIPWQSLIEDFEDLVNWGNEYLIDYQKDKTVWRENLAPRLQSLSEILHLNEILEKVPKHCNQLILIPHRYLHLFPLHALPVSRETWQRFNAETQSPEPTNPCLLDCFKQGVRYAPSCQLLQQAQRRERPNFTHLFAVQNPTNNLPFTDLEVSVISQHFDPRDILIQSDAKKSVIDDSRLRIAHCAHFSCHGYFNFQQPLRSALQLADSELPPPPPEENPSRYLPLPNGKILDLTKCLTLADIFALDFRECRLVVLSACETGISDFNSISDEYISLPSGFLVAGSSSVVPTLWAVNDLSTSFLMIKFYQLLKAGLSVSLALNTAQLWLRDATKEDLQTWTKQLPLNPTQKFIQLPALFNKMEANTKPFQSPDYWAAFCAVGK